MLDTRHKRPRQVLEKHRMQPRRNPVLAAVGHVKIDHQAPRRRRLRGALVDVVDGLGSREAVQASGDERCEAHDLLEDRVADFTVQEALAEGVQLGEDVVDCSLLGVVLGRVGWESFAVKEVEVLRHELWRLFWELDGASLAFDPLLLVGGFEELGVAREVAAVNEHFLFFFSDQQGDHIVLAVT